jgi:hypothetical protein
MILLLITAPKIEQNNHNKFTMIGMIYVINDIYIREVIRKLPMPEVDGRGRVVFMCYIHIYIYIYIYIYIENVFAIIFYFEEYTNKSSVKSFGKCKKINTTRPLPSTSGMGSFLITSLK